MKSIYDQKEAILKVIDRGEWKHSRHLPRDQWGYIEWLHPKTIARIRTEVAKAQDEAVALLVLARSIELPESNEPRPELAIGHSYKSGHDSDLPL